MPAAWRSGCMCRRPALFATTSWKAHYYPALQHRTPRHKSTQYSSRWSGPFTASRARFNPPGSPARRHHSRFSVRPHGWAKRRRWHSCLLPLPILKPASTHCWPKDRVTAGSDGKLSALSVTDTYTWNAPETSIQSKSFYRPPLIRKSQNPELRKLIPLPHLDLLKHQLIPTLYYDTTISSEHQPECDHVTSQYSAVMLCRHLAHIH